MTISTPTIMPVDCSMCHTEALSEWREAWFIVQCPRCEEGVCYRSVPSDIEAREATEAEAVQMWNKVHSR